MTRWLVKASQRPYVDAHPLAFYFVLAVALSGFLQIFFPETVADSVVTRALPDSLRHVFALVYLVGGLAGLYGIARGKPKHEAGGMALLASALAVQFASAIYLLGTHVLGSSLLIALFAIGCWRRSSYLAHRGYR